MNDLFCKPKARCFKGLAILSGIYALACGVMLLIIPTTIKAHGYEPDSQTATNIHKFILSTLICLIVFFALAVLNVITCKIYEGKEKRREAVITGQLMRGDFEQDGHEFENQ